jgi:hypothetical protein
MISQSKSMGRIRSHRGLLLEKRTRSIDNWLAVCKSIAEGNEDMSIFDTWEKEEAELAEMMLHRKRKELKLDVKKAAEASSMAMARLQEAEKLAAKAAIAVTAAKEELDRERRCLSASFFRLDAINELAKTLGIAKESK